MPREMVAYDLAAHTTERDDASRQLLQTRATSATCRSDKHCITSATQIGVVMVEEPRPTAVAKGVTSVAEVEEDDEAAAATAATAATHDEDEDEEEEEEGMTHWRLWDWKASSICSW